MTSVHGGAFNIRHAWFVGGSLLLAPIVLTWNPPLNGPPFSGIAVLGSVFFSAALLVFAFGFRPSESITARRPLGTAALTLLALWLLITPVVTDVLLSGSANEDPPSALLTFGTVDPFVRFALALLAVVQVGRAGVVPTPWNWAPAVALAALAVPWLLGAIVAAGPSAESQPATLLFIAAADTLIRAGTTVVLGVVALLLADKARRGSAERTDVETRR